MEEQSEKRAEGPERGNDGRQRATLWAAVRHPPGVPLCRNIGGRPIRDHDWLVGEALPKSGAVSPLDAALEIVSTRDCGARAHSPSGANPSSADLHLWSAGPEHPSSSWTATSVECSCLPHWDSQLAHKVVLHSSAYAVRSQKAVELVELGHYRGALNPFERCARSPPLLSPFGSCLACSAAVPWTWRTAVWQKRSFPGVREQILPDCKHIWAHLNLFPPPQGRWQRGK